MNKIIDRVFCAILALGTLGHTIGTFTMLEYGTGVFAWSLSGALAASLLVSINFLRSSRPKDSALRWTALVGNLSWMGVVYLFGVSIHNPLDFRVLMHEFAAAGLVYFCLRGNRSR